MRSTHLALRFERLVLTAGFWRGLASTAILIALGAIAKRLIDTKYDSGEWSL
jgi:hypothetical protein